MAEQPKRPLEMKSSLAALEHLGMNLYSTIPAVRSEIVANAWDADAGQVSVTLGEGEIAIQDDGIGMTRDQVAGRFLDVGFQRRPEDIKAAMARHGKRNSAVSTAQSFALMARGSVVSVDLRAGDIRGIASREATMHTADLEPGQRLGSSKAPVRGTSETKDILETNHP